MSKGGRFRIIEGEKRILKDGITIIKFLNYLIEKMNLKLFLYSEDPQDYKTKVLEKFKNA